MMFSTLSRMLSESYASQMEEPIFVRLDWFVADRSGMSGRSPWYHSKDLI